MTAPAIPLEAANGLALDLLRQLLHHIGDPQGIEAELHHWIDLLGVPHMSLVLLEAVRVTFADCLTYPDQWPAEGGIAFQTDKENHA